MSDSANVTGPHGDEMMTTSADSGKGKGKAMDTLGDVEMGEDDDSEEEEEEAGEGEVSQVSINAYLGPSR